MQKSWLQSLQPRSKGWILSELVCWLPCYAGAVTLNLERKRPVSSCIQFMMFQKVLWFMFASCLWLINLCMQTSCHRATNLLVMDTFANVLVLYKTLFIILDKCIWANFFPLGGFMFALMFFGIHVYLLGAFWALWSQFCCYFWRGGPRNTPLDDFLQMFLSSVNYPSTSICLILADIN